MQITITVNGVVEMARNLRLASVQVKDSLGLFHYEAIEAVHERSNELFANKGANVQNGDAWKALSPATEKARAKRSGYYKTSPNNPSVLRWTGRLQNSVRKEANQFQGMLQYTAPYAGMHQSGGGRLPRRKIIDVDAKTATKIVKILQRIIHDKVGIFGLQK